MQQAVDRQRRHFLRGRVWQRPEKDTSVTYVLIPSDTCEHV